MLINVPEQPNPLPYCPRFVNESFDRQHAALMDDTDPRAIKRRVLGALPDGRTSLQRTKTSVRDFERGQPTPGRVP